MKLNYSAFLALLLAAGATASAATSNILTVAVFDFESKDEAVRDLGPKVAALLNVHLSLNPQFITVERTELDKILGEQELGLSGTVSVDSAAKVGHLTGAKVLVTGRVFKIEKELIVVAKVIGTETGRVYGEMVKGAAPPGASITDLAVELAGKVAIIIQYKGDTLLAKVLSREERIQNLARKLSDRNRPSIAVRLSERHFGGPTFDPAAETEMAYILDKCGFKVISDKSAEKPDLEISGEAFSEFGVRRGNLISCKGRLELKAHEKATGKMLVVERQTSVAVDVSEHIAAKTALQNAALALAERILPRLIP